MAARRRPEPGSPAALRDQKRNALDRSRFHFLENLIVFCAQPSRRAPKESGVCFGISSAVSGDAVCLLFQIDRAIDPLMPAHEVKPDYLVVHVSSSGCICTIVEMKGVDAKKAEHAVDQITNLWRRLRSEVAQHLPPQLSKRVHFQGLILTPSNVQVPGPKLERVAREGLCVTFLAHHAAFELASYVNRKISRPERYVHTPGAREPEVLNFVEASIAHGALPVRVDDRWHPHVPNGKPPKHTGICIDVAPPPHELCRKLKITAPFGDHDVARLVLGPKKIRVAHPKASTKFVEELRRTLRTRGLSTTDLFVAVGD